MTPREVIFKDDVSVVWRGPDGRYYVNDVHRDKQNEDGSWSWHTSTVDVAGALASARHTRQFWDEKETMKDNPRIVRAEGEQYYIGAKGKKQGTYKGYGGAKWRIEFKDGRVVETDNLWSNGTIPPAYRERMPDNAVLVNLPYNATLTHEGDF